jgi:cytochrome c-type biogenesis protein CcmF
VADVGFWALVLILVVSAYTTVVSVMGARKHSAALLESARNGAFAAGATATAATVILLYLLISADLSVRYVYEHVNSYLPTIYRLSALWAGQEGSLLLWLWLTALMSVVIILRKRVWAAPFGPYVLAVMAFTQGFLAVVLVLISSPFSSLPSVPAEGQGLNPLLQNVWMVIHPPVVFVGYAAYTVPFALVIGGLATRQLGKEWLQAVRRWSLFAWLFLGTGILMGAWWAYLELGWGGYWAWDPVENSSLIPWLTGTALLHSLMMQRRKDAFRAWNVWLVSLTFLLCVFATFITRSGIIQSVHAFQRSAIGTFFVAFIGLCLTALAGLVSSRRHMLRGTHTFSELLSREASMLLANLLFVSAALVVLLGTMFPALVELVQGQQAALDISFYERTVGPLMQLIIVLIGICPWLAWNGVSLDQLRSRILAPVIAAAVTVAVLLVAGVYQVFALISFAVSAFVVGSLLRVFYQGTAERRRRTGEQVHLALLRLVTGNRRRYGAHVIHLGVVFMAVGVTGSSIYQEEVQVALAPGERMDVQGYTLEYQTLIPEELPGQQRFTAVVGVYRGDRQVATLLPKKDYHWNVEQWVTEIDMRSTLREDLYLILASFEQDGLASFRVLITPLVLWLWIGGIVLCLGGAVCWWPTRREWNLS